MQATGIFQTLTRRSKARTSGSCGSCSSGSQKKIRKSSSWREIMAPICSSPPRGPLSRRVMLSPSSRSRMPPVVPVANKMCSLRVPTLNRAQSRGPPSCCHGNQGNPFLRAAGRDVFHSAILPANRSLVQALLPAQVSKGSDIGKAEGETVLVFNIYARARRCAGTRSSPRSSPSCNCSARLILQEVEVLIVAHAEASGEAPLIGMAVAHQIRNWLNTSGALLKFPSPSWRARGRRRGFSRRKYSPRRYSRKVALELMRPRTES